VTEHAVLPGLYPIQGDGVLARQGDFVLLIHPAGGAFTDRLLDLLAEAARGGGSGRWFTDLVSAEFDSDAATAGTSGNEPGPAAVAFGPDGDGTAIALYGAAWAEVTTAHGTQRLTAGQPHGRLRCTLPSPAAEIRGGVRPDDSGAGTDRYLRLADGVVRAVGLVYYPETLAEVKPDDRGKAPAPVSAIADQAPVRAQADLEQGESVASAGRAAADPAQGQAAAAQDQRVSPAGRAAAGPEPEKPVASPRAATLTEGYGEPAAYRSAAPTDPQDELAASGAGGLPDRSSAQDFISVPLFAEQAERAEQAVGDVPERGPLPLGAEPPEETDLGVAEKPPPVVTGVYCKNSHFNDPEARYCAVCGIGMAQQTKVPREGTRPPLGVLVLDDGSVFQLDADYVVGREPALDTSVVNGSARPLRLAGASTLVSRSHVRVELDGWQVFVCDLHSANGTQILLPGEKDGEDLQPGVRTPLVVGAQIRLGRDYGIRYDSHRHR
jgi:FHA domain